ncbi:hypothetical protein Vretifemale_17955, partial [Volvox reticuliferus]
MSSSDGSWFNNAPNSRRTKHKASDLYDLSFELEVLSHRDLNLVSGPRHMTIKPNYDALLIQGYTQVWRPRHVTTVTFELAVAVPLRSFAILHDARRSDPETTPEPTASCARRDTNGSYTDAIQSHRHTFQMSIGRAAIPLYATSVVHKSFQSLVVVRILLLPKLGKLPEQHITGSVQYMHQLDTMRRAAPPLVLHTPFGW